VAEYDDASTESTRWDLARTDSYTVVREMPRMVAVSSTVRVARFLSFRWLMFVRSA
jgi:hypothetical protein